jgi:hypothetical protein
MVGGFLKYYSTRDIAQVTAPGATASMIAAVSTRPNKQNRSARSSMRLLIAFASRPLCEQVHSRPKKSPARWTIRRAGTRVETNKPCARPSLGGMRVLTGVQQKRPLMSGSGQQRQRSSRRASALSSDRSKSGRKFAPIVPVAKCPAADIPIETKDGMFRACAA